MAKNKKNNISLDDLIIKLTDISKNYYNTDLTREFSFIRINNILDILKKYKKLEHYKDILSSSKDIANLRILELTEENNKLKKTIEELDTIKIKAELYKNTIDKQVVELERLNAIIDGLLLALKQKREN